MLPAPLRRKLKPLTPAILWRSARRSVIYVQRLLVWLAVSRQVEGVTAADRAILKRSARAAFRTALTALDEWRDPDLLEDATVRVKGIGEFRVRAHSDDLYHVLPAREQPLIDVLHSRLRSGDTFIDAGANIGFFTVLASGLVGEAGRVIAIEMMPDTAERLRFHVAHNSLDNVEVIERALSAQAGDTVTATVRKGLYGQASIISNCDEGSRVTVPTDTIDELLAVRPGRITVMKMDLERAELLALQGAAKSLPRIDAIIFEQLDADRAVPDLLKVAGFTIHQLSGTNFIAKRA